MKYVLCLGFLLNSSQDKGSCGILRLKALKVKESKKEALSEPDTPFDEEFK